MATSIDAQLRDLMPNLSATPPDGDIAAPAAIDGDLTPEFGTPRKRRSRKKGAPAQPLPIVEQGPVPDAAPMVLSPVEREQIGKALGVGLRVIFAIVASKRGQHWQLDPNDEQLLGATWTDALAPWLVTSSKYVPIAVATLATIGVVVPRMDADARLRPQPIEPRNPDVPAPTPEVANASA